MSRESQPVQQISVQEFLAHAVVMNVGPLGQVAGNAVAAMQRAQQQIAKDAKVISQSASTGGETGASNRAPVGGLDPVLGAMVDLTVQKNVHLVNTKVVQIADEMARQTLQAFDTDE